jgi:Sec-independent protein translocase protein TatA
MLLFGVGRVEKVGKELGSTISAFRKGLKEGDENNQAPAKAPEIDTKKTG